VLRGGPLEIPGGWGVKIPTKNFVQRKMPGKKFAQPLRQRKKIRASKQQSANSLEKKILQRRLKNKIVPQKFYTPPPGISNGLALTNTSVGFLFGIYKFRVRSG
jgi:hypothetical protein